MNWLKREWSDLRAGARILTSRDFWRTFAHFYSGPEISRRLDDFAHNAREATGQKPDPKLEARRKAREQPDQETDQ